MATRRMTRSMSREPQAVSRSHAARKTKPSARETVIDLTMSDDEDASQPAAGPSRPCNDLERHPKPSGSKTKLAFVLDETGDADDEPRVLVERNDRTVPPRAPRTLSRVLAELQRLEKENDMVDVEAMNNVAAPVPLQVHPPPFLPVDHLPRMAQQGPDELDEDLVDELVQPPSPPIVQNDIIDGLEQPAPLVQPNVPPEPAFNGLVVDPLARVLEVVPDVEPEHAQKLIDAHIATYGADKVVAPVLHLLLEDPTYPKVQKGKRKAINNAEASASNKKPKIDYGTVDRPFTGGMGYREAAVTQLTLDYPYISKSDLRRIIGMHRGLYAPTFLYIREEEKKSVDQRQYGLKKTASKGKGRAVDMGEEDEELANEIKWINEYIGDRGDQENEDVETEEGSTEAPEGEGVECGCCFGEYSFDTMIQCPDAHLFCISCVRGYASTKLADGHADVPCPSSCEPPCKMLFPESELRRALKDKQMELWYRVRARRDLESAGLDGLEECPFCDYAAVVENPDEKLFRCAREECGEVSCRACKKKDHLPKSCKEADEDNVLDAQHAVEEAMTKALMRNCPKCKKAFVKEAGCNKMTCPYCHTLSCYICRQIITGYDHFDQMPNRPRRTQPSKSGKCALWDDVEKRHHQEVEAAAQRALAEVRAAAPEVDANAIRVDMPAPPPAPPVPHPQALPPLPPYPHHLLPMGRHDWIRGQVADQVLFGANDQPANRIPHRIPHPPPLPRLRELDIAHQLQVEMEEMRRAILEQQVIMQQRANEHRAMQERLREEQRRARLLEAAQRAAYRPHMEPPPRAGNRGRGERAAQPRWR